MQSQVLFPLRSLRKLEVAIRRNKRPRSSSKPFSRTETPSPLLLIDATRTESVNLNWDTQSFFVVKFTGLRLTQDTEGRTNCGKSVTEGVQMQLDSDSSRLELS